MFLKIKPTINQEDMKIQSLKKMTVRMEELKQDKYLFI